MGLGRATEDHRPLEHDEYGEVDQDALVRVAHHLDALDHDEIADEPPAHAAEEHRLFEEEDGALVLLAVAEVAPAHDAAGHRAGRRARHAERRAEPARGRHASLESARPDGASTSGRAAGISGGG